MNKSTNKYDKKDNKDKKNEKNDKSSQELLPGIHETFFGTRHRERQSATTTPEKEVSRSVLCVVRSCFSD